MKKVVKRFMALVLVMTLVVGSTNIGFSFVKADEVIKTQERTETESNVSNEGYCEPEVVEEVVSDRTTDSTTFLLSNGMKQTTYYSDDIYFTDEKGKLSEYDNELVKLDKSDKKEVSSSVEVDKDEQEEYKYVNNKGDSKQFLPNKLSSETPVVMTKDDYVLSFAPINSNNSNSEIKEIDNILSESTEKVSLDSQTVTNIYNECEEEKNVIATYECKDEETSLSYESLEHGLKETIILDTRPESNIFSFELTLQDMYAKVDKVGGGITIYSDDDDIVGGIEAPFMNDATKENYSENLHYELESINDEDGSIKYVLRLVVDENYLDNATYPVVIDPTITWKGTTDLPEAYVLKSSASTNYFSSGVKTFSVGKGSQGVFRTYFRARKLASTVDNKYIDSATLTIYENGSNVSGSTIYVKPAAASFKCGEVTWNNQPGGTSATLASFKSKGTANAKHEINLKTWAQNVAKGSGDGSKCYGLLFKASSETSSSYVKFYGARAASYVPKLKVVYYDAPATATSVSAKCSVDANRNYIKSGESLKVSWSGISAHALSYIQYRITDANGNTLSGYGYSTSTKIGTTASGSNTINVSGLSNGTYKVYVRGVDKGGIVGTGKGATFYIDKTKPVITSAVLYTNTTSNQYSEELPELDWCVNDSNFSCIQVSVNNGVFNNLSYEDEDCEEIAGLVSGQPNTIKVRALDKAGNISDIKSFTYYYDNDSPTITASVTPETNNEKMDNSKDNPILKYAISDKTLSSYEITLNEEKVDVSSASGEVELKNVGEGENSISISAVDKAGNESEQELIYYRDTVAPEKGTIKISPKTGFLSSSKEIPVVKWAGINDDNLSEVQIKINDGEYRTLGLASSGEGQLSGTDFPKDGKYTLTIRGIDKAGNISEEVSNNYYYETSDYELDDYTPVNVYATEQIGGNTILRFSTKNGKFRDDVKYQVYRSETPNVVINEETFVKSYSSKGMIKLSGEEGKTYYYKLRTVKKLETGAIYSDYSEEISSTTIGLDKKNNRLGTNSMFTYSSISTPNGSGQIELSKGNLCYEQDDISLPAISIPVKITRYYNSKSTNKSSFGYGWNCEYDSYISECNDKIYYSDGTQAVYTFENKDNKYECIENADMLLEIDDDILNKTIEKTSGEKESLEVDVHYKVSDKNGEILRFDDAGRLTLIEEANDNFVYIAYSDKDGTIKSVLTDKGQKASFEYNEDGLVSKITAADKAYGYLYTYKDSYLVKATYLGTNGKTIEYNYSYLNGLLTTISDANGNDYMLEYNTDGAIEKFVKPNGEYALYSYNYMKTESRPETAVSLYNGLNLAEKLSSTTYNFSTDGRITEKKDESGNITTYIYDDKKKSLLVNTAEKSFYYALEDNVVVKMSVSEKENTEYYSNGSIKSETDSLENVTTYEYNDTRNDFTKIQPTESVTRDSNSNIISNKKYEYDEKGNIIKETDLIEKTITKYEYNEDGSGLVNKVTETLVENANDETNGIQVSVENTDYNEVGDEKNENSVEGTVEEVNEYTYDTYGNVTKEKDLKTGNITEYTYDAFFRTEKITETKTEKGKTTVKTTQSKYDNNGNVVESIEYCRKAKYDDNGNIEESVEDSGRVTTYTYDSLNRVKTTTLKVGSDTKITNNTYTYGSVNVYNGVTSDIVDNAFITTTYNEKGEELGKTYVDGNSRTVKELSNGLYNDYTYDSQGKVLTTYVSGVNQEDVSKNVEGKLTVTTYDAKGNQTATITNPKISGTTYEVGANSIVTKNKYDVNGNVTKSIDGEGNVTLYEYDNQGRITKVTTPEGNENSYKYDNIVNDKDLIDLKGVIDNKVVESTVTDAKGNISKTYDNGAGQVLKIIDVKNQSDNSNEGISTVYEYDDNGQQTKEIYSDGSFVQFEYEASTGYLIKKSKVDKEGNCEGYTTYTYNTEGSVESAIDYKDGKSYRYTYYGYDKFGRNISVSEINASSTPSNEDIEAAKLKYVYDVDDNIEKIYYPNNANDKLKGIKFIYNKDKWITEIDGLLSGDDTVPIRKYEYYNDSKIKSIKDYKNFLSKSRDYIQRDYIYDDFDRVTSMQYYLNTNPTVILESYEYKYDNNSNITYKHEKSNYSNSLKDEEISYSYDSDGRLVGSEKNNKLSYKTTRCTYKYDKVGNRTYESEFETDTVATEQSKTTGQYLYNSYNNLNQLISSTVIECKDGKCVKNYNKSYKYDEKGNQVSATNTDDKSETTYIYDVENQLVDVKLEVDNVEVSKQHNDYNGSGQRIRKTESKIVDEKSTTTTTCYFYEGSVLLYTADENGKKTSQNIIGNQNNTFAGIRYEDDKQSEYFYSKDVQGSTTVITNKKGECEQSYSYTDYGETTNNIDNDFYNEICYTGGVYDALTGLYYLNARYYDSDEGSFLSQDTYRGDATNIASWNLYGYCAGNPINYVDPSGHFVETAVDIGSIAWSAYDFVATPSWATAGFLAWDVGAALVPFLPGSYTAKGAKIASKTVSKADKIKDATRVGKISIKVANTTSDLTKAKKSLTIGKYTSLRKMFRGKSGIEIHHVVEKRLIKGFKKGVTKGNMLCVPLHHNVHKAITARWRKIVPYGTSAKHISKKKMLQYCRQVYHDMPEMRKITTKYVNQYWRY